MNSNFDFEVDRAGDGVHNKSVSPLVRIIIRRLCQEWSPLPVMKHLSQNHVKVD